MGYRVKRGRQLKFTASSRVRKGARVPIKLRYTVKSENMCKAFKGVVKMKVKMGQLMARAPSAVRAKVVMARVTVY